MKYYQLVKWVMAFFLAVSPVFIYSQQNVEIKGIVYEEKSQIPIEFANISIKNAAAGTTTDAAGRFKIIIAKEKQTVIIVSHINYHKKEIVVNDSLFSGNVTIYLSPKEFQLSDVVISAGLYEQPIDKLTKPADLISHREIVDNMNSNITDVLNKTPGFTQVWEYHSPIILRGLNSNRLIIMKDGNRRIGTFPGGYFGQDMNIYDSRKIEIIKGPGSVIYGSGAISGIINLVSAEPFGDNKNSVQLSSGYGSNNNEFLELVKVCHKREKFGISLNGKYRKTGEMIYGNGEIAENSNVEDRDISLNTGYKFSDKHKIIINANYHYGDWGKPRGFNGPTKRFTKVRNEEENFHTDFAYSYTPKGIVESVNLNLYYDNGWRDYYQYKYSTVSGNLSTLDLVHYKNSYGGGRFYTILNVSEKNKLTTGIDGYLFRLDNPSEIFDYYNDTHGSIAGSKNAGQQNIGAFINDEWQIGEKWQFVSGIRFDAATVVEGEKDTMNGRNEKREAFSGNAGFVYSPNKTTHISFNAGRAFRMPTTEELFTRIISCKGIKVGNPALQPEYSWNFDIGIRGKILKQKLKYDLALFYNILDDFINEAPAEEPDVDFTLKNTDAKLMGGEFSAAYQFNNVFKSSNSLYLGTGAAYVYGVDLAEGENAPLFGIPPFKMNTEIDYRGLINKTWVTGYSIKFDAEYASAQNRVAEIPEGTDGGPWGYVPSDPNTVFNFALGLNSNALPGYPKLRFMVKNIFNTDYQPFGSYIPAMGRNFKILLSFHF
ncbi:Colicin I receptor precursor [Salinivirga cyanobacteriivorans]|uniref:Colicin I receptor n=1 Tax=Salinivirga cyanobacteriivorans TaxID=1307839 RepID=A0A0S2I5K1_9BACT|nr:TonB-dependent receptor [Salinivirga cyanobacteriivorans]ALO17228.1 Colicin I receptor precursor [Salinivirga cyanobacteriivorans]